MATQNNDARINVRLASDHKLLIEEASAALGQTVSDFTVSTLLREARQVIEDAQRTSLSNRDRDRFLEALNETASLPNKALKSAARKYRRRVS